MCVGISINLTGLKKIGCQGYGDFAFSYQSAAVGCLLLVTCVAKLELCVFMLFGLFGVAFESWVVLWTNDLCLFTPWLREGDEPVLLVFWDFWVTKSTGAALQRADLLSGG